MKTTTAETHRKRIAIYHYLGFTHLRGGTLKTVKLLADAGHDVTFSLLPPRDNAPCHIAEQLPANVEIRLINLWTRGLPRFRGSLFKLVELTLRHVWHAWWNEFDLYVGFDAPAALAVLLGTRLKHRKSLYLALELFSEMPWVPARPLWRLVDRFLCPRIDALVTMDAFRAQYMADHFKARAPKAIRNTPPYRKVERTHRLDEFLRSQGVADAKVALYQGNIEPTRVELMLNAAGYLDEHVVMVFQGWSEKEYLERIRRDVVERHLEKRVFFLPAAPPDEVGDFTASADVGVLVYQNACLNNYFISGASLKFYEYLMAGLPVVAPNFPGFPEIVEGQQLGKCVDPTDARAIAAGINSVLANEAAWNAMHERALQLARDQYNWEIDGATLLAICEGLATGGQRPAAT